MCYDISTNLEAQLSRASRKLDLRAIKEIEENLATLTDLPIYHTTGFSHPKLLIYTDRSPWNPEVSTWGLVPHWVKDKKQLKELWNKTLNARGETIFEKPSFRESVNHNRCLIYINGFYEHHHLNGKTFPFYIHQKNDKPLALAGLWSEWTDRETGENLNTFSIVTTKGNKMLAKIHNNPKLEGPRMPLILPQELEDNWLHPIEDELDVKSIQELIREYPDEELDAYTVKRLRGKEYIGNVEKVCEPFEYAELKAS
ncbi:SOS response-associated peptidase [Gillisia sp. Q332]|uniref:SOS response-associated peptidase n=1 Tax=Gillisia xinjiangensis TaxID=3384765 RepID=UPI00391ADFFF